MVPGAATVRPSVAPASDAEALDARARPRGPAATSGPGQHELDAAARRTACPRARRSARPAARGVAVAQLERRRACSPWPRSGGRTSPDEAAADAVGLDQDQGALRSWPRTLVGSAGAAAATGARRRTSSGTGPREPLVGRRARRRPGRSGMCAAPGAGRDVVGLVVRARRRATLSDASPQRHARAPGWRRAPCGSGRRIVAARPGTMWSTIRSRACARSSASSTTPGLADDHGACGSSSSCSKPDRASDQPVDLGDRHADRARRARDQPPGRRPSRGRRACRRASGPSASTANAVGSTSG